MPTTPAPAPTHARRARRPWYARPAAAATVHGVTGLVTGIVGFTTEGLNDAVMLTFGVLAGIMAGPLCTGPERRLARALAVGAVAMPVSLLSGALAWGLAGFHLARAFAGPPERPARVDHASPATAARRDVARRRAA